VKRWRSVVNAFTVFLRWLYLVVPELNSLTPDSVLRYGGVPLFVDRALAADRLPFIRLRMSKFSSIWRDLSKRLPTAPRVSLGVFNHGKDFK
jgi:hypothetical protein